MGESGREGGGEEEEKVQNGKGQCSQSPMTSYITAMDTHCPLHWSRIGSEIRTQLSRPLIVMYHCIPHTSPDPPPPEVTADGGRREGEEAGITGKNATNEQV